MKTLLFSFSLFLFLQSYAQKDSSRSRFRRTTIYCEIGAGVILRAGLGFEHFFLQKGTYKLGASVGIGRWASFAPMDTRLSVPILASSLFGKRKHFLEIQTGIHILEYYKKSREYEIERIDQYVIPQLSVGYRFQHRHFLFKAYVSPGPSQANIALGIAL